MPVATQKLQDKDIIPYYPARMFTIYFRAIAGKQRVDRFSRSARRIRIPLQKATRVRRAIPPPLQRISLRKGESAAIFPSPASAGEVAPDLSGVDGGARPPALPPGCCDTTADRVPPGTSPHPPRHTTRRPPPLKRRRSRKAHSSPDACGLLQGYPRGIGGRDRMENTPARRDPGEYVGRSSGVDGNRHRRQKSLCQGKKRNNRNIFWNSSERPDPIRASFRCRPGPRIKPGAASS